MSILRHSYFDTMHDLYFTQVIYFVQHLSVLHFIRCSSQFSRENSFVVPYFFLVWHLFTTLYWSEFMVSDSLFSSFPFEGSQRNQNLRTGQIFNANVCMRIAKVRIQIWNKTCYVISELRMKWKWGFVGRSFEKQTTLLAVVRVYLPCKFNNIVVDIGEKSESYFYFGAN